MVAIVQRVVDGQREGAELGLDVVDSNRRTAAWLDQGLGRWLGPLGRGLSPARPGSFLGLRSFMMVLP
eukprot:10495538-Heterocapsa_arctica.AAC.1